MHLWWRRPECGVSRDAVTATKPRGPPELLDEPQRYRWRGSVSQRMSLPATEACSSNRRNVQPQPVQPDVPKLQITSTSEQACTASSSCPGNHGDQVSCVAVCSAAGGAPSLQCASGASGEIGLSAGCTPPADASPPERFLCPITRAVMLEPVALDSGMVYERSSIQEWLASGNTTCPLTRKPVSKVLTLQPDLQAQVYAWLRSQGKQDSYDLVQLSGNAIQVADGHFLLPAAEGSPGSPSDSLPRPHSPRGGRVPDAALAALLCHLSNSQTAEGQTSAMQALLACLTGPRDECNGTALIAMGAIRPLVAIALRSPRAPARVFAADVLSRLATCQGCDVKVLTAVLELVPALAHSVDQQGTLCTLRALAATLGVCDDAFWGDTDCASSAAAGKDEVSCSSCCDEDSSDSNEVSSESSVVSSLGGLGSAQACPADQLPPALSGRHDVAHAPEAWVRVSSCSCSSGACKPGLRMGPTKVSRKPVSTTGIAAQPGEAAETAAWVLWLLTANPAMRSRIATRANPLQALQRMLTASAGPGCALAAAHLLRSLSLVAGTAQAMLRDGTLAGLLTSLQCADDCAGRCAAATAISNCVAVLQTECNGVAGGRGRIKQTAKRTEAFLHGLSTSPSLLGCLAEMLGSHARTDPVEPSLVGSRAGSLKGTFWPASGAYDRLDWQLAPYMQRAAAVLLRALCSGRHAAQPVLESGCAGALVDIIAAKDPLVLPAALAALRSLLYCVDRDERAVLVAMGAIEACAALLSAPAAAPEVQAAALHLLRGLACPDSVSRFRQPGVWRPIVTLLASTSVTKASTGLHLLLAVLRCSPVPAPGTAPGLHSNQQQLSKREAVHRGTDSRDTDGGSSRHAAWPVVDDDMVLRGLIRLMACDCPGLRLAAAEGVLALTSRGIAPREHLIKAGAVHALVDAARASADARNVLSCDGAAVLKCLQALRSLAAGGAYYREHVLGACEGDRQLLRALTSLLGPQHQQQGSGADANPGSGADADPGSSADADPGSSADVAHMTWSLGASSSGSGDAALTGPEVGGTQEPALESNASAGEWGDASLQGSEGLGQSTGGSRAVGGSGAVGPAQAGTVEPVAAVQLACVAGRLGSAIWSNTHAHALPSSPSVATPLLQPASIVTAQTLSTGRVHNMPKPQPLHRPWHRVWG